MPHDEQYYDRVLTAVQDVALALRTMREQVSGEAAAQIMPLARAVGRLETLMYGDAQARQAGVLAKIDELEKKIDQLIDQSEARLNQWRGMRMAIVVIGALSSVPALQALGRLVGVLP